MKAAPKPIELTRSDRTELMQFQRYLSERLRQLRTHLPEPPSLEKSSELAFLEEQVVEDAMPRKKRQLRDPLKDVPIEQIVYTNLPLLNRFVSESGAILPRKLTGVPLYKQLRLAKAIKRAQNMALMPKIWKDPRYRQASYASVFAPDARKWSTDEVSPQSSSDALHVLADNCSPLQLL
ncbi:MAG: hypothetical protein SGPRY_007377 [Prymnesium sp.]